VTTKPNKTQATEVSVEGFLDGVAEPRRGEAQVLRAIMERVSGEPARMWGPSIVGCGEHHYRYERGREGVICKIGFAPRKPATVIYGLGATSQPDAIAALGKVSTGKGCVYIKRLSDIDLGRLETLLAEAVARRAD
jgi:hypothetical protein